MHFLQWCSSAEWQQQQFFVVQCAVSIRLKASATTHFDDFHCYDQDYYFCCCCCCCSLTYPSFFLLLFPLPRLLESKGNSKSEQRSSLSVFPLLLLLPLPSFLHFFTLLASFRQFFPSILLRPGCGALCTAVLY